jgi:hypothetical protein
MKRVSALALSGCLVCGYGWAQEQPPTLRLTPQLDTPQAQELLRYFEALCLDEYPSEQAVTETLQKMGAAPMPADFVRGFLNGPGQGWRFQGKNGDFIVTLKAVPDRHCAVRTASEKLFAPDWRAFLHEAASTRHQELSGDIDYDDPHPDGSVSHAFVNLILTATPMENYTMIVEEHPERTEHRVETRVMRRVLSLPSER